MLPTLTPAALQAACASAHPHHFYIMPASNRDFADAADLT
mgnify:CR=1 FL=1